MVAMFVLGLGLGFLSTPYLLAVQNAVPRHQRGVATSSVQFFRTIGGSIAVAALGTLLNAQAEDWCQGQAADRLDLGRVGIKPHPRHLGKTIALYSRWRVEALIEARQPAYLQMLISRAKQYRRHTAETCRQAHDLIAWARTVEIVVATLPRTVAQLAQETIASFRLNCAGEHGDPFVLTPKAMVAHARHTCTNYHRLLNRLQRGPGATVAYLILKRRVNQAVREKLRQQYGAALTEAHR